MREVLYSRKKAAAKNHYRRKCILEKGVLLAATHRVPENANRLAAQPVVTPLVTENVLEKGV